METRKRVKRRVEDGSAAMLDGNAPNLQTSSRNRRRAQKDGPTLQKQPSSRNQPREKPAPALKNKVTTEVSRTSPPSTTKKGYQNQKDNKDQNMPKGKGKGAGRPQASDEDDSEYDSEYEYDTESEFEPYVPKPKPGFEFLSPEASTKNKGKNTTKMTTLAMPQIQLDNKPQMMPPPAVTMPPPMGPPKKAENSNFRDTNMMPPPPPGLKDTGARMPLASMAPPPPRKAADGEGSMPPPPKKAADGGSMPPPPPKNGVSNQILKEENILKKGMLPPPARPVLGAPPGYNDNPMMKRMDTVASDVGNIDVGMGNVNMSDNNEMESRYNPDTMGSPSGIDRKKKKKKKLGGESTLPDAAVSPGSPFSPGEKKRIRKKIKKRVETNAIPALPPRDMMNSSNTTMSRNDKPIPPLPPRYDL